MITPQRVLPAATQLNHLGLTCEIRPQITFPDGTTFPVGPQDCWTDPVSPPIPSGSSKYANGTCQVCVSQSLPELSIRPTIGSRHDYQVRIRDNSNHDMGSFNGTLAAFGGETGDMKTVINMTVGGKQFNLWTMQEASDPTWALVFMDWREPGPLDPFAQPQMLYSSLGTNGWNIVGNVSVGYLGCEYRGESPFETKNYFQCGFKC